MSPLTVVTLTVLSALGYVLMVVLLFNLFLWLSGKVRYGTDVEKLVALIPFIVVGAVCLVLHIIHSLLLICLGVRLATSFRDWWKR